MKRQTTTAPSCRNCGKPIVLQRKHKHPSRFCSRRCSQLYSAYSEANRPAITIRIGHPLRCEPATRYDANRPPCEQVKM